VGQSSSRVRACVRQQISWLLEAFRDQQAQDPGTLGYAAFNSLACQYQFDVLYYRPDFLYFRANVPGGGSHLTWILYTMVLRFIHPQDPSWTMSVLFLLHFLYPHIMRGHGRQSPPTSAHIPMSPRYLEVLTAMFQLANEAPTPEPVAMYVDYGRLLREMMPLFTMDLGMGAEEERYNVHATNVQHMREVIEEHVQRTRELTVHLQTFMDLGDEVDEYSAQLGLLEEAWRDHLQEEESALLIGPVPKLACMPELMPPQQLLRNVGLNPGGVLDAGLSDVTDSEGNTELEEALDMDLDLPDPLPAFSADMSSVLAM
jgi:hypothetical protein